MINSFLICLQIDLQPFEALAGYAYPLLAIPKGQVARFFFASDLVA